MSWHWIIDDLTLAAHEVLVLVAIRRYQNGDKHALLRQEVIARSARLSLRSAQSALASTEARGYLEVIRRKNHASMYRVVQKQGLIFSNANFHTPEKSSSRAPERAARGQWQAPDPQPVGISVEIASVPARAAPPGPFGTHDVRTFFRKYSGKPEDQNPPAGPAGAPQLAQLFPDPDQEQRCRIEARDRRVLQEIEALQESLAGAGPSHAIEAASTLEKIAQKMGSIRPVSAAEWERRKVDQKERLSQYLQGRPGG